MFYRFVLTNLFVLCYIGASLVFQSPSLSVDLGVNVTLWCDITHVFVQCSAIRWFVYRPAGGLVIYSHLRRGLRTVTNAAQRDTLCLLNIPQTRVSDNGTFYCVLLNEGVDYVGNGTVLTVLDTTDQMKVNEEDHTRNSQQIKKTQCLVPVAACGGISLVLIILTVTVMYTWQRRGLMMHQKNKNRPNIHQQFSSETQYASLRFGPLKQEGIPHSSS